MGPSPGRIKSVAGALSSAQAARSRGRGGWRQRKLGNFNGLREQPKVLCRKVSAEPVLDGGFKARYRGFAESSGARDRSRFLCEGRFGGGVFPVCRDPGFVRA